MREVSIAVGRNHGVGTRRAFRADGPLDTLRALGTRGTLRAYWSDRTLSTLSTLGSDWSHGTLGALWTDRALRSFRAGRYVSDTVSEFLKVGIDLVRVGHGSVAELVLHRFTDRTGQC